MSQVLILAGDTVAVRSIMMSLQMEGFEPVRVSNGDDLLTAFGAKLPAGVLVDLGAPWTALSGLLRRVRAHGSGKKYRLMLFGERPPALTDAAMGTLFLQEEDIFAHPVDIPAVVRRIKEAPEAVQPPPAGAGAPTTGAASGTAAAMAGAKTAATAGAAMASAPSSGARAGGEGLTVMSSGSWAVAAPTARVKPSPPSLGRLFYEVVNRRSTGQLDVTGPSLGSIHFLFRDGEPLGVEVQSGRAALGELLVAQGRLTETQRNVLTRQGPLNVDTLLAHALVPPHEIPDLLKQQLLTALTLCVTDTAGTAVWHEGRAPRADLYPPGVKVVRALLDAFKLHQGGSLSAELQALCPSLDADTRDKLQSFGILPFELRVLKELNGGRTLQSLVESLGNNNPDRIRELMGFFNGLVAFGVIGIPVKPVEEEAPPDWGQRMTQLQAELERMNKADPFAVLEVDQKAAPDVVKQRFFALSKQYHPDRAFGAPPEVREMMENIFRKVGEAYEVVSDPKKKEEYLNKQKEGEGIDARLLFQAEISFNQGALFLKNNNFAKARQLFEESVKLNNMASEYKAWLGWALFLEDSSKYTEAAKLIADAVKAMPNFDKGFYFLGCIFKARNEHTQAENAFKKAVGINPNNIEAQRELRLIAMRREKAGPEAAKPASGRPEARGADPKAAEKKSGGLFGFFKKS